MFAVLYVHESWNLSFDNIKICWKTYEKKLDISRITMKQLIIQVLNEILIKKTKQIKFFDLLLLAETAKHLNCDG